VATIDRTNDPHLKSWLISANEEDCHFPIQNLPYGVFSRGDGQLRAGVAIGDHVLDLALLAEKGLLDCADASVFSRPALNDFMALGADQWRLVRHQISDLLRQGNLALAEAGPVRDEALAPMSAVTMHMPFSVSEYTDFYASREHATNVGEMFRDPENALMPNWLHMPIGYNGRASTVVVSGTDIRRPLGQVKMPSDASPALSASRKMDIELEVGAIVGVPNAMGEPISVQAADAMIFGYVLLNDWSARDIQVWEYQPLGPFQSKVFGSTISPWIVTPQALAPFRVAGPQQDPEPLAYLRQQGQMNLDIHLEVTIQAEDSAQPTKICETNFRHMYWSCAQQLTHHALCGCAMRTGDLLGSGTISGPKGASEIGTFGSLLELTWNGRDPLALVGDGERTFIEDGDEVVITGWSQGDGYRVGFGSCTGRLIAAPRIPEQL